MAEKKALQRFTPTSNEKLNVPMTEEQWDVVDFIAFEAETSFVYPFAIDFDDITMEIVDRIVAGCNGHTNDDDTLYAECERVLRVNPELLKVKKQNPDSQIELWNWFDDFMAEQGFRVLTHNDEYMGRGSIATRDDKFAPFFSLHVWGGALATDFLSIHVTDRNGNSVLTGETVAIYSMADCGDRKKNLMVFSKMVHDVVEKYGFYSKANRLDFVFNEMKLDRQVYNDKVLSVDELVTNAEQRSAEVKSNNLQNVNLEKE